MRRHKRTSQRGTVSQAATSTDARGTTAHPLSKIPRAMLEALPAFLINPDPEIYLSDNFLVIDLETNTKGDDGSPDACFKENSIVCGSWCHGLSGEAHNVYGNELEMGQLVQAIEDADFIVAHNGKFDVKWLSRAGLDMYKVVLYDTMLAEYVLNGNRRLPLSLDVLSTKYFGVHKEAFIDKQMKHKVDPSDMIKSKLIARCNWDVLHTRELFLTQLDIICKFNLLGCVYTRCILSPALADIECNGMHIDSDAVGVAYREAAANLASASAKMDLFTDGINPRSPKQVKEFVYEVLKFKPKYRGKGKNRTAILSTKTEDLCALKATTKRQREFLVLKKDYALWNAEVSKNLLFFHGVATDKRETIDEGVFYAQFNQAITVTHRLSSSGIKRKFLHITDVKGKAVVKSVQFQNFKRKFKPCFNARKKGWSMGEGDGSQLEFRVAAFQGQCKVATQDIVNNLDVHQQTSDVLTGAGQPTDRQHSKAHTFKPLFGGMTGTEAEVAYYEWFTEHYSGIGEKQQEWIDECLRHKQFSIATGFTFFFPDCHMQHSGYVTNSTNIKNIPVQHLATAEIIPIAVTYLWHAMKTMESFIVNTIHDSAIAELHPDEHEQFEVYCLHAFTTLVYFYLKEVYGIEFNVPLGIGVKIGDHWGTGHERKCVPMAPYLMDGINYEELITEWVND